MKKFTTLLLVLALTLSTILSVVPIGVFADSATEITDNSGYSGGIRKKSDSSILFSPFISPLRELVNGGASVSNYTIDMTFTLLSGENGTEVYTFDTVSAAINTSNGQYFDIYLNGTKGNSGFCPEANKYYDVYVEIYQGRTTTEEGTKVFYGTYTSMKASSDIASSTYYAPTAVPVSAPQITETKDGYEGNITYLGEGIRKRSGGQIAFCPYITELRNLIPSGQTPADYKAELTFSMLTEEGGEVKYTFDPITLTPTNGTGYFYLTLADTNGTYGFCPTAGEYYDIEVNIYDSEGKLVTYGTYKNIPAQDAIAESDYYAPTPMTVQITETTDGFTGTKLYKNGIRKNSGGSIMVSAFITELRAQINAGKSYDMYTIKAVFSLLGDDKTVVATFPEVTLKPNSSNGNYFDIPLKNSGFCPTAGSYYNIQMEIYEGETLKFYGTYKDIVALDDISTSAEYMPTPIPGAPVDYNISLSYSFNNALKGSAAGTIYFTVDKPGYFEITWGDKDGNPLTTTVGTKTLTYSELVKFNVTSATGGSYAEKVLAFTAIPQGAETLIVVDSAENVLKTLILPVEKLQHTDEYAFSFGAISDLHYEYFFNATTGVDDAIYAVDTALAFYEAVGAKLVVATGDFSKYTEEAAYQKYQIAVNKVKIPVLASGGNHEVYGIGADKMFAEDGYWRTYVNNGVYDATMEGVLDVADNGIDFAYSYPGLEDYVFVSLSQWKWDGHTASQDCLVTDSQLLWMEEMFETYKDKTVYLLFHTYLGDDDYESIDGEGDMTNPGGYTYGAFYNKYTKDEKVFRALLDEYENVIWFNGHSHYEYSIQKYNENLNIFDYMGTTATMIHVPSVTNARTLSDSSTNYSNTHGTMSQGALMFVYDGYQIMNGVDLWEEEVLSYACYIVYDDKTDIVVDGTIDGTDITWTWDAQLNSLRILGTGAMPDFTAENPAPWAAYLNDLMTVYVGAGITYVGSNAFSGAANLTKAELKEGVTKIGENAFANTALDELILPESLQTIGENAFGGIAKIEKLIYSGSSGNYALITVENGNDALEGTVTYRKFKITWVVDGSAITEEYKQGETPAFDGVPTKPHEDSQKHYVFTGWSDGNKTLTSLPKVTAEATYTAVFGSEVDRFISGVLSETAFWAVDRTLGTLFIFGEGAMPDWNASNYAMRPWMPYSADIYHVAVGEGITTVGGFAFCHLDKLETVKIAPTVKTIKADAFSYNAALKTLYIPSSVTAIGQGSTYQSNNLKTVYGGWDTVSNLLTAIGTTAYNDALKAADYVPMADAEINPEIPEIEVKPSGPAATETIQISPAFGKIENYGGITYLLSYYTSSNNAYIVAGLKNGSFTMKLTIKDEDTGITYFIDKYFFDVHGNEFYGTDFFRFALGHYGITLENHKYSLQMDIYCGEDLVYTGTSEKGVYVSNQEDFLTNGAITPENVPHTSTNDAPAQSGDAAIYATIAIAVAAVALAVVFKKRTTI